MATTTVQVVFDCADPDRQAHFWAAVLGYTLQPPPEGYDSWDDALKAFGVPEEDWNSASAIVDPDGVQPRIYFQRVPEPKTVKNRLHLDVNISGGMRVPLDERKRLVEAEATRMAALGAHELYRREERGGFHITMTDPEGNEFCVH
jgi:hypothetical protein